MRISTQAGQAKNSPDRWLICFMKTDKNRIGRATRPKIKFAAIGLSVRRQRAETSIIRHKVS
jgi:hypothetical protein